MLTKEMLIKLPENIENLYFCGDIHGNLDYLKYFIKTGVGFSQKISNSCIVLCGDVGLGFSPNLENMKISFLNKLCEKTNNYIIAIRGNHDNPEFFKGIYNKRFKAVEDYSVVQFKDKNILCIGGGTSIDRIYRKDNKWGYWEDEKIIELTNFEEIPYCQIIASHCAPTCAYPYGIGKLVMEFCDGDDTLLEELLEERNYLQTCYEEMSKKGLVEDWYYGHYHSTMDTTVDNTRFHLLGINYLSRYCYNDYN